MRKKLFILLLAAIFPAIVFAQDKTEETLRYKIVDVQYNIDGRTRVYALDKNLDIDKKKVFESKEQLDSYLDTIRQSLTNQRVLQDSSLEVSFGEPTETGIVPVTILITAEDTWNVFPVPYPKYNSNSGFEFKLKVKDYNFFGSMEVMDFDLAFFQEDEGKTNNIGLGFDFSIPFNMGVFDSLWFTDADIEYAFGDYKPGFSFETGLDISFPMEFVTFHLIASQKIEQDREYDSVGDELFLTEYLEFNAPFVLVDGLSVLDEIVAKPYVCLEHNWDMDGIAHEDLIGPLLSFGAELSAGKIDWIGNFRKGLEMSLRQNFGYNYGRKQDKLSPRVSTEIKGYYPTRFVGFNIRLLAFTYYGMENPDKDDIGSRLRGVRDDERYNNNQVETSSAIVLNLDFPVKVVQTDWIGWGKKIFKKDMPSWFRYFDFELQLSPFLDIALTKNTFTGRTFHPEDGFYSAGLEMLIYPTKMRSIQVRLAAGFDVSPYLFDAEWRSRTSPEIEFGVGLHY